MAGVRGGSEGHSGGQGGGAAEATELAELIAEDQATFCQKDVECGRVASLDDCFPAVADIRCTQDAQAIRECLEDIQQLECNAYLAVSGSSCVPLNKSPDGC